MKSIILLFSLQRMIIDWSIYKHGYDFVCTIAILWRSLLHLTLVTIVLHCCITVYTLSYSVLTSLMHLWIFYKTFPLITSENMPKLEACRDSPNSLHRLTDALNVLIEKSTLQSMYLRSGSCTLRVLCMGVKWMTASAVMLYWSSVHRVLSSQMFRSGHHMAWSDQSMAISERKK